MSAAGIGNDYVDGFMKFVTQSPTSSPWPATINLNAGSFGIANLYLAISSVAYDATGTATYTEPTTGGYARITIPTGSTNFTYPLVGTATLSEPSGPVTANTNTYRYAQLASPFQFPTNTAATAWTALYLLLLDQPGVAAGKVVAFGPKPNTPNTCGQNSILTVPAGTSFQFGIAR